MHSIRCSAPIVGLIALLGPGIAAAQDASSPLQLDLGSLNLDAGAPRRTPSEWVWVVADTEAVRWREDAATSAGTIPKDTRCEVVMREAGFVRLRYQGNHFGWIAETATTKDRPASAGAGSSLPSLQPPGLLGGGGGRPGP